MYTFSALFAENYNEGFVKYWSGLFGRTENVVLLAVGVGLACIAVIMMAGRRKS